jgi:hypothetical protein
MCSHSDNFLLQEWRFIVGVMRRTPDLEPDGYSLSVMTADG